MYATTVGLVLAGFKALDDREDIYRQRAAINVEGKGLQKATKSEPVNKDIFSNIRKRLQEFITNDIGDDSNY
jgi:cell division protein FtsA